MTRGATTQNRVFQYDNDGRMVSATHPESGTSTLEYNDAGLLWKKTDAKGQVIEHLYDALNRLTEVKRYNVSGRLVPGQGVKYTWDTGTEGNKLGLLQRPSDPYLGGTGAFLLADRAVAWHSLRLGASRLVESDEIFSHTHDRLWTRSSQQSC